MNLYINVTIDHKCGIDIIINNRILIKISVVVKNTIREQTVRVTSK